MKPTLLLGACLLTALSAIPASASPIASVATLVAQASVNPVYIKYEDIKSQAEAIEVAAATIEAVLAAPPERGARPISAEDRETLGKVGQGQLILSGLIRQAIDDNTSQDAAGATIVDFDGFGTSFARLLNNKNPELTRFASIGWDTTEKRAASKIATLAKKPSFEGSQKAIIAILIGMLKTVEGTTYYVGTANVGVWKTTNAAAEAASDYETWRANYGTGTA